MTVPQDTQQVADAGKQNDKDLNFEKIRRALDSERAARQQAEARLSELEKASQRQAAPQDDEDDDSEPYIDKKRLKKESARVKTEAVQESKQYVQEEVHKALAIERQQTWMKNNPDFYEVMNHAQTLADKDPELAETILSMPEGFERQKLVYKNIKAMGLHKKEEPKQSIQDKIDANRRSPYYQPSGISAAPYAAAGDFSQAGQKNAYAKMKELQAKLRM